MNNVYLNTNMYYHIYNYTNTTSSTGVSCSGASKRSKHNSLLALLVTQKRIHSLLVSLLALLVQKYKYWRLVFEKVVTQHIDDFDGKGKYDSSSIRPHTVVAQGLIHQ